jgi:hypothetical protein
LSKITVVSKNVVNGKAFEWAVAKQFSIYLGGSDVIGADLIVDTDSSRTAKKFFETLDDLSQQQWDAYASAGVYHLVHRERNSSVIQDPNQILISSDSAGISGDVRDVILASSAADSIGVSCKNNHDAFKHPRLSGTIDFVKDWGLSPNGFSDEYWAVVGPIFDRLAAIRQSSGNLAKFDDIDDLRSDVMKPIMTAFVSEIGTLAERDPASEALVCSSLVKYVIGTQDFYKMIKDDAESHIRVMGFNFNGSLSGRRPRLPKSLIGLNQQKDSLESGNSVTVFVQLDLGYAFKFRLHTASSRVEPSLKFDVQAVGLPPRDVYQHFIEVD